MEEFHVFQQGSTVSQRCRGGARYAKYGMHIRRWDANSYYSLDHCTCSQMVTRNNNNKQKGGPFLVVHMHHVVRHTGDWMRLRCRGGNWKSLIVATPRIGPSLQLRVASHQFAVPTHYSPLCHSPAPTPMSTIFMEHAGLSLPWRRRVPSWPCCRLFCTVVV